MIKKLNNAVCLMRLKANHHLPVGVTLFSIIKELLPTLNMKAEITHLDLKSNVNYIDWSKIICDNRNTLEPTFSSSTYSTKCIARALRYQLATYSAYASSLKVHIPEHKSHVSLFLKPEKLLPESITEHIQKIIPMLSIIRPVSEEKQEDTKIKKIKIFFPASPSLHELEEMPFTLQYLMIDVMTFINKEYNKEEGIFPSPQLETQFLNSILDKDSIPQQANDMNNMKYDSNKRKPSVYGIGQTLFEASKEGSKLDHSGCHSSKRPKIG